LALDLVIAMPISWWPLISDYNRFARSERKGGIGTFLGYTVANSWFYFLGAAFFVILGAFTPVGAILTLSLGGFALLFILVDETDNAFANIYSTAVSSQNLLPKWKQKPFIVIYAGLGAASAYYIFSLYGASPLQGLGSPYELFLLFIGGFFVPLLGTMIADYFVVRRGVYSPEEFLPSAAPVRWPAMTSWFLGIFLYFLISGSAALGIPGFVPWLGASLPAFGFSFVLHSLLSRVAATEKFRTPTVKSS